MDENDMSIANQSMPRDLPVLHKKLLSQPALSPSRSKTVPATSVAEMKSPLPKSKPKQRYLKRGTGLQTRLAAAKQKHYVPKGGFIKCQAEDEAVQQPHAPASSLSRDSDGLQQAGKHSMPAVWPQLAHPSSAHAEEPSPPAHRQHDQAGMAHRQSQGNSQPYTNGADQEAEMDADTALVHFPGTAQQSRQGHGNGQQSFEPYISAHHPTAAPHVLKGGRSLQQQDRPHADCSMHNDPLQAAYMQSNADNGAAPVDWQLQQAAEVKLDMAQLTYATFCNVALLCTSQLSHIESDCQIFVCTGIGAGRVQSFGTADHSRLRHVSQRVSCFPVCDHRHAQPQCWLESRHTYATSVSAQNASSANVSIKHSISGASTGSAPDAVAIPCQSGC